MGGFKITYISSVCYPSTTARALQIIQMAAAFARQTGDTHLFVENLYESDSQIREQYNVLDAQFRIWSLFSKRWFSRIFKNEKLRIIFYNPAITGILKFHTRFRSNSERKRVIFVRSRLEILYWGILKPYFRWLRDWILVCEIHGLDLPEYDGRYDFNSSRAKRYVQALRNFDCVITLQDGLAKVIRDMTEGEVKPDVLRHGTSLKRLAASPLIRSKPEQILLGYIGTVDLLRGIDCIISALRFLPGWIRLRIIGRIKDGDIKQKPNWLSELLNDPDITSKVELCPPVPYKDVAVEIDTCDIVIQPAGLNLHASRYASPLKLFDYMARGKPIVAAGVPSHLELLKDNVNALIYKPGDPQDLARCIKELVEHPRQAEVLARNAWEQSINCTYDARVRRILTLVQRIGKR
jgi:glycosyltransferase involved in cell wall biosynthesis